MICIMQLRILVLLKVQKYVKCPELHYQLSDNIEDGCLKSLGIAHFPLKVELD